jgi:hypothetical protein
MLIQGLKKEGADINLKGNNDNIPPPAELEWNPTTNVWNGGYYYNKYLKYKQKYLKLHKISNL